MAHPDFISWHEKEGKAAAGQIEITPGSTLTVGDLQKGAACAIIPCSPADCTATPAASRLFAGMMIRTFDADQLWLRVPSSTPNAEAEHKVRLRRAADKPCVLTHWPACTRLARRRGLMRSRR